MIALHRIRRAGRRLAVVVAVAFVASIAGCGGTGLSASGGIGGSGYVSGPIEEFGSLVVGGIRFDVDEATVVVNGETAALDELSLGMFVGVYGDYDEETGEGTATRVEFDESVRGPIERISPDRLRFVVLGQAVKIDDATRFDGVTPDGLRAGMVVTVSGSRDANDAIVATFVARRLEDRGCRVLGEVSQLAADGSSFVLGDLAVDASAAVVVGGVLDEGDDVAVFSATCPTDGTMLATEVRRLDATRPEQPGSLRSVRGFVVEVRSADAFVLHVPGEGRVPVRLLADTEFLGGDAADVSRNVLLRVTGTVDRRGVLRAKRVAFLDAAAP